MMLALVADIAIKAVTLNSYLLGSEQVGADDPLQLLYLSPGVVLIDELDNDSEVALALGCVLDVPPPPLEQPARTPTATSRNAAESVE